MEELGMRWDSWEALASKKWVRMEDTGRVDEESGPDGGGFRECPPSDLDTEAGIHVFSGSVFGKRKVM